MINLGIIKLLTLPYQIAHIRATKSFLVEKNYYFIDIASGVDIAAIVALCMTLDGRIEATSGQFTYHGTDGYIIY